MSRLPSLNLSWRFIRVWQRNMVVYQRIWLINFIPPLLEPLFYLIAFGLGLSTLITNFHYEKSNVSYLVFITPAILSINIMQNGFFETTYASFVRMYYQKTFDAMLSTPLSLEEIISAEIVWGATKATVATCIMQSVISAFGLIHYPLGLLVIPLAFLGGIAFGSIGMFFTGIVPTIDVFNLPIFLFITPMFLFSGTFFPIEQLPQWAQTLALAFPLTHLVRLARHFCIGILDLDLLWNLGYLLLFTLIFFPLALIAMHHRLIR